MKKILILTSGPVAKLDGFREVLNGEEGVVLGSFYDIAFDSENSKVKFQDTDLKEFDLIYFRLVGKSLETAALIADYAKENRVKIVDKVYEKSQVLATSVSKYLEYYKLSKAVKIPKTIFGSTTYLKEKGPAVFGLPYIVKSTSGRKARDVWFIDDDSAEETFDNLRKREIQGDKFFAQSYIKSATRIRILIIGDQAVAGIVQPSKFLKRVKPDITDEAKEALKVGFTEVPEKYVQIAVESTRAVDLDISGVDILEDENGELFVIEANAAPAWKLINKYCDIKVEQEIVDYLKRTLAS